MTTELTITRPDDWHIHLRDGDALETTVADASRYFGRAIVMPNLVPPVRTAAEAGDYRDRIKQALGRVRPGSPFEPLMVLYLTDRTQTADIAVAATAGSGVTAAKLYPAGATTNSDAGVTDPLALDAVFEAMQEHDLPLLVHGEVTGHSVDVFDREKRFIDTVLQPLVGRFPKLRLVLEHISTADAVEFVQQAGPRVAATITAHHLLYNRNHLLAGNIRPHYYCLPILKRSSHQQALRQAATSGNPKFFLGTDSAPHSTDAKEHACGCAGCYTAHAALELYAQVFEEERALDKLEAFASWFGPDFYQLPRNTDRVTLVRKPWTVPAQIALGEQHLQPLCAGETLNWQLASAADGGQHEQ